MKKNNILKILLLFIFAFFVSNSTLKGQNCYRFHETTGCSGGNEGGFKPYGQSKSGMLEINKMFEYKLVLYGNKDYKIIFCTEHGKGPVHYKIIEARSKNVLFDNSTDDYVDFIGFTNDFSQSVIIEITLMGDEENIQDSSDLRACVGVNIVWRSTPKIGF